MTTPAHAALTVTIGHALVGWNPVIFLWGAYATLPDVFVWIRYRFDAAPRWAYYDTYHEIGSLLPWWLRLVLLPLMWPYELHVALDAAVHRPEGGIFTTRYVFLEAMTWAFVASYWVALWQS